MTLVSSLQEAQRIFGFCPCCNAPFRLSELRLFVRARAPRSPFDELENAEAAVARSVERFEEQEGKIRERARAEGQALARRTLRKQLPYFTKREIGPQDVKVLFHPVEYVAFPGLADGECERILLIDRPAETKEQGRIQESIEKSIASGRVEWRTFRVDPNGRVSEEKPRS